MSDAIISHFGILSLACLLLKHLLLVLYLLLPFRRQSGRANTNPISAKNREIIEYLFLSSFIHVAMYR